MLLARTVGALILKDCLSHQYNLTGTKKNLDWATPMLDVLDILTLVTTNSAIVERLWSMYNAIFTGEAAGSSTTHRKIVMKSKFDCKHARVA